MNLPNPSVVSRALPIANFTAVVACAMLIVWIVRKRVVEPFSAYISRAIMSIIQGRRNEPNLELTWREDENRLLLQENESELSEYSEALFVRWKLPTRHNNTKAQANSGPTDSVRERPLRNRQIEWRCVCGRRFSYKVIEERPGGAQDLQDHLNKNFLSTHPAGNSQGGVSNVRFWRRYVRSLFSGSGMQSNEQQLSTLPTHTQPSAKLVAPQIQQAAATLEDPRFLHIAMRDSTFTRAPTLSSEESSGLTTDIELFSLLWDRYERCAAQRWSLLPWKLRKKLLRPPMRMRFIQFNLLPPKIVGNITENIPPVSKTVSPPQPPEWMFLTATHPGIVGSPIDSDSLVHLFTHPEHVARTPDNSFLVKYIPQKTTLPLDPSSDLTSLGRGLYIEETPKSKWRRLAWFVMLISGVFCVIWWAWKKDIAGASGMGQFLIAWPAALFLL